MKKIVMLAAMLAMLIVAAVPAMAQVEQGFDQDSDSGEVDQSFTITGGGSNGSSCTPVSGSSQSGNVQDATGNTSFDSDIEDSEQEDIGNDLSVGGSSSTECTQEVNQAAVAASPKAAPAPAPAPKAAPAPAPAPKAAPAPAPKAAPAPAPAPKVEEKKEEAKVEAKKEEAKVEAKKEEKKEEKKEAKKELPKTGGSTASLIALGTGTLLIAGGLLARRMVK